MSETTIMRGKDAFGVPYRLCYGGERDQDGFLTLVFGEGEDQEVGVMLDPGEARELANYLEQWAREEADL